MKNNLAHFFLFTCHVLALICQNSCVNQIDHSPPSIAIALRNFDTGIQNEWIRANELRKKISNRIEKIKMEGILKEEANRRRIYEQHLLSSQGRSNFLKDFHTNRF
jgi:hypothetical protein